MTTATVKAGSGGWLNVRYSPEIPASGDNRVGLLADDTEVSVLSGPVAGNWYAVLCVTPEIHIQGYCSGQYLSFSDTVIVPPPPTLAGTTTLGLHFGSGGASIWNTLAALIPSMQCATVIDTDGKFANSLVGRVKYLIFRYYGPNGDTPAIPANPVDAAQFAVNWLNERWPVFAQLDPRIHIQVVNEETYQPSHVAFWDTIASRLKAKGYKAAIGAYAPANLEIDQWQALAPMLVAHQSDGHIFTSHIYSQAGTTYGNLSADVADYESRPIRWYASTPDITMPWVASELGNEWTRGKNVGVDATASFAKKFLALYAGKPWFTGGSLWTLDQDSWKDANIAGDVSELVEQGIVG